MKCDANCGDCKRVECIKDKEQINRNKNKGENND